MPQKAALRATWSSVRAEAPFATVSVGSPAAPVSARPMLLVSPVCSAHNVLVSSGRLRAIPLTNSWKLWEARSKCRSCRR